MVDDLHLARIRGDLLELGGHMILTHLLTQPIYRHPMSTPRPRWVVRMENEPPSLWRTAICWKGMTDYPPFAWCIWN